MKQFLLFKLGLRNFSLEVDQIQEIVENPALHFIPCAPPFYCGAINFHGEILPILELGSYLGWDEIEPATRVIVLTPRIASLALKVATARRIIAVDPQMLHPSDNEAGNDFILSTFALEGEIISVLNLNKLLHHLRESSTANSRKEPL